MKTLLSVLLSLLIFSSCTKTNEIDKPVIDPPFEKFKYFWTEIEKKEGTGAWVKLPEGNVLRLFTNDSTGVLRGQYEYNAANSKINIPESYFFAMEKDSLYFYKPAVSDPNKADIMATLQYELLNDKVMVIRNKSVTPNIEIKYSKQ